MSDHSSSVADDDAISDSSTLKYDQESYETFSERARALMIRETAEDYHLGYRNGFRREDLMLTRMAGGAYNRLIRFSIRRAAEDTEDKFHTDIPVPRIIKNDCHIENEIYTPWMIQNKVEGDTILYEWPSMSHKSRCVVAEQLGMVYRQCLAITGDRFSRIVLTRRWSNWVSSDTASWKQGSWDFDIAPIRHALYDGEIEPGHDTTVPPYESSAPDQSTVETLAKILEARRTIAINEDDIFSEENNEKFLEVLREMKSFGIFKDMRLTLCHTDLEVRNIMADASNIANSITAILDWNEAIFAPAILACRPPMWLWAWKEGDDEDEREANDTPDTIENQELKTIFERAAGPVYNRFAYGTANRLARLLVRIALFGMHSSDVFHEAEDMLKEWSGLKSDLASRCE